MNLFDQTVTVYRLQAGQVQRSVLDGCFCSWRDEEKADHTGTSCQRPFLLIVPGQGQTVLPGDRVYPGIGPQVDAQQWPEFLPVLVPGLCQAAYARQLHLGGTVHHTEAGAP